MNVLQMAPQITVDEIEHQKIHKILLIGFDGEGQPSTNLAKGFIELGYQVTHCTPGDIIERVNNRNQHIGCKERIKLSRIVGEFSYDLIFVCQNYLHFENDLHGLTIVAYYHTEIFYAPSVYGADIVFHGYAESEKQWDCYWPREYARVTHHDRLMYGIDLSEWDMGWKKKCREMAWCYRTSWVGLKDNTLTIHPRSFVHREIYRKRAQIINELAGLRRVRMTENVPYSEYKKICCESHAVWVIPGTSCYVSQRIFEAAAAGACPLLYVENETANEILTEIGFEHEVNCIKFRWSLPEITKHASLFPILGQRARQLVAERHTNIHRVRKIFDGIKKFELQKIFLERYNK